MELSGELNNMVEAGELKWKATLDESGFVKGMDNIKKSEQEAGTIADETTSVISDNELKRQAALEKTQLGHEKVASGMGNVLRSSNDLALGSYVLFDSFDKVEKAKTASERADLRVSKSQEAVQKAQDKLNQAIKDYGPNSAQAQQAELDLDQANQMLTINLEKQEMAHGDVQDSWVSFATGVVPGVLGVLTGAGGLISGLKTIKEGMGLLSGAEGVGKLGGAMNSIKTIISGVGASFMVPPTLFIMIVAAAIAAIALIIILNWGKIKPFFEGLWNAVKPAFEAAWKFISGVVDFAWNQVIKPIINFMRPFIEAEFNAIKTIAMVVWGAIEKYIITPIQNAWAALQIIWNIVKPWLEGIWNGLVAAATTAWNLIRQYIINPIQQAWGVIQSVWNAVRGFLVGVWNGLQSAANTAFNLIRQYIINPMQQLYGILQGIWNTITGVFRNAWNTIIGIVQGAVNFIMGIIRPILDIFNSIIGLAGRVTGAVSGIKLPKLWQTGGLISGPVTLISSTGEMGQAGEANEEEIIIPRSQWQKQGIGGGGGQIFNNTFNIKSDDPRKVAEEVVRTLKRQGGSMWIQR